MAVEYNVESTKGLGSNWKDFVERVARKKAQSTFGSITMNLGKVYRVMRRDTNYTSDCTKGPHRWMIFTEHNPLIGKKRRYRFYATSYCDDMLGKNELDPTGRGTEGFNNPGGDALPDGTVYDFKEIKSPLDK